MAINICTMENDLSTFIYCVGNIHADQDFSYLKKVALEMNLTLIAGLGEYCDTIINKPQIQILEQEIQILKTRHDVNQNIVNELQNAVNAVIHNFKFIRFIGE